MVSARSKYTLESIESELAELQARPFGAKWCDLQYKRRYRALLERRRYLLDPEYGQRLARDAYHRNPSKSNERSKQWARENREKVSATQRERYHRVHDLWGYVGNSGRTTALESEVFVAEQVLPKNGFTDILTATAYHSTFPADILARKGGRVHGILVTRSFVVHLRPKTLRLLEYLGIPLLVCHLRPDYSWYILKEPTTHYHSDCSTSFLKTYPGIMR